VIYIGAVTSIQFFKVFSGPSRFKIPSLNTLQELPESLTTMFEFKRNVDGGAVTLGMD